MKRFLILMSVLALVGPVAAQTAVMKGKGKGEEVGGGAVAKLKEGLYLIYNTNAPANNLTAIFFWREGNQRLRETRDLPAEAAADPSVTLITGLLDAGGGKQALAAMFVDESDANEHEVLSFVGTLVPQQGEPPLNAAKKMVGKLIGRVLNPLSVESAEYKLKLDKRQTATANAEDAGFAATVARIENDVLGNYQPAP